VNAKEIIAELDPDRFFCPSMEIYLKYVNIESSMGHFIPACQEEENRDKIFVMGKNHDCRYCIYYLNECDEEE